MRANLEEAENKCRDIARDIKSKMPSHWGFVLIMATHGEKGFMTYMSSLNRSDCIKMMEEMVGKLKTDERSL